VGIGFGEEAVDCILEFSDGTENAPPEAALGQQGEQALDCIEPGYRRGSEVEDEARMVHEALEDLRMLVSGIVVDDDVDGEFSDHPCIDHVQEANELLMAMALHALSDNLSFEHVEGGETRWWCRAVCSRGSSWQPARS